MADKFIHPPEFDGSHVMTILMRTCVFLITAIVSLLLYEANQIIDHAKDLDARLSSIALHQVATEGEVQTLTSISTDQGKRLERLEQRFFDTANGRIK